MMRQFLILLYVACICTFTSFGQEVKYLKYKGRVVDEAGNALNYVNIFPHANPPRGTISFLDGRFELEAKPNETIDFEYIGREYKTLQLNGKDTVGLVVVLPLIINKLAEMTVSKILDIPEYVEGFYEADHDIFQRVIDGAHFPGGEDSLRMYLQQELHYPEEAYTQREEGQVLVQFTITTQGKVSDVKIVKGVSSALNAEAERVIRNMPDWKPAAQRGRCVAVCQILPVNFTIRRNFQQILIEESK